MCLIQFPVIPDEVIWLRGGSSDRLGQYQSVPPGPSSSSTRSIPPSRTDSSSPPPTTSRPKRIVPVEFTRAKVQESLPEGCVDLFVAESESSSSSSEDESSSGHQNVWRKMKGRLQSDISDFTSNGAHLQ